MDMLYGRGEEGRSAGHSRQCLLFSLISQVLSWISELHKPFDNTFHQEQDLASPAKTWTKNPYLRSPIGGLGGSTQLTQHQLAIHAGATFKVISTLASTTAHQRYGMYCDEDLILHRL
jgi:hypothetical protein